MRLTDQVIRDELRREASSVPIPTDMWEQINHQMKGGQRGAAKQLVRRFPLRYTLVAGLAAGIFWLSLIPTSSLVERSARTPAPEAPTISPTERRTADPVRDPTAERWKKGAAKTAQAPATPDVGRSGPSIAMY